VAVRQLNYQGQAETSPIGKIAAAEAGKIPEREKRALAGNNSHENREKFPIWKLAPIPTIY
jgi:hypothetical protein